MVADGIWAPFDNYPLLDVSRLFRRLAAVDQAALSRMINFLERRCFIKLGGKNAALASQLARLTALV